MSTTAELSTETGDNFKTQRHTFKTSHTTRIKHIDLLFFETIPHPSFFSYEAQTLK
jgi:hypothetical protein